MRDSRLWRLALTTGASIGVALTMQCVSLGQTVRGANGEAVGQVVSGPTSANYGFPSPAAPKPKSTWTNPFSQAATAIQNAFRPSRPQVTYPTGVAPGDPTSLKTDVPALTPQVHLQAARLAFARNRLAEAKGNYEQVLAGDPNHLESLVSLARIADAEGGYAAANPYYVRALNAHPQRAAVHNDFGMTAARNEKLDIALLAFAEAVRLEPKNVRYRNNYAKALLQAGQSRGALEQLVAAHPPAAAHYNFAFLVDQLGGPSDQILFHARQALRFDPGFAAAQDLAKMAAQRQLAMQASPGPRGANPGLPPQQGVARAQHQAPGQAPLQRQVRRPVAPPAQPQHQVSRPAPGQAPTQARAFLPSTQGAPAPTQSAPYVKPSSPYVDVQAPAGNSSARNAPPTAGYRQSRRMPAPNDSMFPPQSGRQPVYLPPAAPSWSRR